MGGRVGGDAVGSYGMLGERLARAIGGWKGATVPAEGASTRRVKQKSVLLFYLVAAIMIILLLPRA